MDQDISPPTSNQNSNVPQGFGSSPAPEAPAPQEPVGRVIPLQSGPKKSKLKAVFLTLLFLVLLGAVAGAYYYQQGKINDISAAKITSDKQVVSLQTQLNAKATAKAPTATPTTPAVNYNIVTGSATTPAIGSASLNALYKPGTVEDIWVEYGTAPDALKIATTHITQGLGAGEANTYVEQTFKVTGLTAGQKYFYHVAAKAKGTTVYGGVTSFTSTK